MNQERKLLVLYGSQTGTAQDVAERIGREARLLHFQVRVCPFDDIKLGELPEQRLVAYVVSTTGQGEEPDNMRRSWRFLLRKSLPASSLQNQMFGVLGLGDSSYLRFNLVAKKLTRRLLQLGGCQLLDTGLGDDQHDLGADFVIDPWLETFWKKALGIFPLPVGLEPLSKNILPVPKYSVRWLEEETLNSDSKIDDLDLPATTRQPVYAAPLVNCQRLTPLSHFQDVRLVELELEGGPLSYRPGDVAVVQPANLIENVDTFFSLFPGLARDRLFYLEQVDQNIPLPPRWILPQPCTVQHAVEKFFDIQSIPRRYFFELLSHFSADPLEKEKCLELSTAEGQQDLYEYCNRPRRNILEVLYDFRHTTPHIPFQYLFDLIPMIKSRSFSIASSEEMHKSRLQLLVAVVQYRSKLKAARHGLCSTWLSRLQPGNSIPIQIRSGTLKFPSDPAIPCIMVGPGTGLAPFRSFISSELARGSSRTLLLFFGCRHRDADYFFWEEWQQEATKDRSSLSVITAFSRDQEDKVYVQHRVAEHGTLVAKLVLQSAAYFYVAGNSKQMPTAVRSALVACLAVQLEGGETAATSYVESMEASGRYQTETWA